MTIVIYHANMFVQVIQENCALHFFMYCNNAMYCCFTLQNFGLVLRFMVFVKNYMYAFINYAYHIYVYKYEYAWACRSWSAQDYT